LPSDEAAIAGRQIPSEEMMMKTINVDTNDGFFILLFSSLYSVSHYSRVDVHKSIVKASSTASDKARTASK
jgi:hypothetical protein